MSTALDRAPTLGTGLHTGIPFPEYLKLDAMGSSRLEWLAVSPMHYRYMLTQPAEESPSLSLGTALHAAVLTPEIFAKEFLLEPVDQMPLTAKPRATKVYREAVAELEAGGFTVLRTDVMETVRAMAASVHAHPWASKVLARCPLRELTMIWDRNGRRCRGRIDALGNDLVADLKSTRSLAKFSPWAITDYGLHRQTAFYREGLAAGDLHPKQRYFIAIESSAPFDCGVFVLDDAALVAGANDVERLLLRLDECEHTNVWPGQFPNIETATVSDRALGEAADECDRIAAGGGS